MKFQEINELYRYCGELKLYRRWVLGIYAKVILFSNGARACQSYDSTTIIFYDIDDSINGKPLSLIEAKEILETFSKKHKGKVDK